MTSPGAQASPTQASDAPAISLPTACAIGVDVGGTKIAAGLVQFPEGTILSQRTVPARPQRGGYAVLTDAVDAAVSLLAEAAAQGLQVVGIGVDICELVDPRGCVTSGHTVAWDGLPVREAFAQLAPSGRPVAVAVEADVRAHALAEAHLGAGRGRPTFVFVTVGTGISSCFVQHGVPFAGTHGNALVLASSPYTTTCTACGATLRPVLEEIASGPGLVALYNQRRAQASPTVTSDSPVSACASRAEDVLQAATAGDEAALSAIHTAAGALGVSIGWLVNVLDPAAIVIGGGLGSASGTYWDQMVASAREHIWSDASRSVPIVPAALGPAAGLIGAALAAVMPTPSPG
jgi:glucokinase